MLIMSYFIPLSLIFNNSKELIPMRLRVFFIALCIVAIFISVVAAEDTRLVRQPAVSETHIAFVYAGDLWIVDRSGGQARRLTTSEGTEILPWFSPDGKWIAFSGQYDGNMDVFVIPVEGGEPRRLTYHPGFDLARGWSNDGKSVVFSSGRAGAPIGYPQLWTVPVDGGFPQALPLPAAHKGVFSPDGQRLAYVPHAEAFAVWRHYRGGRTTPIWIADLATLEIEKIPRENSNDTDPMWMDNTIYFISDRNGTMNLFGYDTDTKSVRQLTFHDDYDIRSASAGGGRIAYEQSGNIHVYNPATEQSERLSIEVAGDINWARPRYAKVETMIRNADISPTGVRAVFESRGDIFTVPAEKGDDRNITMQPGVHNRNPVWSPDGKLIAWFSDEGGEYHLVLGEQTGLEPVRRIQFENPSFYYYLTWSPDSKKLAFTDKHLNLWYLDIESSRPVRVDTDTYDHPARTMYPVWSPDSKWLTYSKRLVNHMHAVFLYSLAENKSHQLTDGLSDAVTPAFDRNGKHLYFLASTNYGLNAGWLDMMAFDRPVTRSAYLVVLSREEPSPFKPESDEEKPDEEKDEKKENDKTETPADVRIDLDGIDQRIIAVESIPPRDYYYLTAGDEGILYYMENVPNQQGMTLHFYDVKKRESTAALTGINSYTVSANGKKVLYGAPGNIWGIVDAGKAEKVGDGKLNTAAMEMRVEPRMEWAQMFDETWRINRDYFYDPGMHGADWNAMKEKYREWVKYVSHRSDLTYVLQHLMGELAVGHSYIFGGDSPNPPSVQVGLLGADYAIEDGFYKIAKIYTGENWNPDLRAPLTEPGLNISEGEYILAVNGRSLRAPTNIYSLFEATAGKQTVLLVNNRPSEQGARRVTVVPVSDENGLRSRDWVENNRRRVDELSGGRLAYVYLPNTAGAGYTYFNRYFYSQLNKQGAVIDERFNGGGTAADYIIEMLNRPVLNYWATRNGKDFKTPLAAMDGPKVMIINEWAGSGGDALPYYFRKRSIGPLIGTRTWGGLVGVYDYPSLIDGGFVSAPRVAFYTVDGEWKVENEGVAPDIEVEQLPVLMKDGGDPQLERAVREAMRLLEQNPPAEVQRDPYPVRVKK
jgi:tricorn protease